VTKKHWLDISRNYSEQVHLVGILHLLILEFIITQPTGYLKIELTQFPIKLRQKINNFGSGNFWDYTVTNHNPGIAKQTGSNSGPWDPRIDSPSYR